MGRDVQTLALLFFRHAQADDAWAQFMKLPIPDADRAQLQAADAARTKFVKTALEPAIAALERSDLTT